MADVYKFPNKHRPVQPPAVRVATLDDGFIRIPNDLYEALILADLNKREQKVAHAIVRKTYGFNKQFDRISDSQLTELTGIHRTHVCTAKKALLDRQILKREGKAIGLNKVVSEWKSPECQNGYSVAVSATPSVAKSATGGVANLVHTKDTIQKTQDNPPLPPIGGEQSADADLPFIAENSATKKSSVQYQAFADAYNAILGGRLPRCETLSNQRKRAIKTLVGHLRHDRPAVEAFTAYLEDFRDHASGFYFGDNNRGWRANFDFMVRLETLIKAREGALMEGGCK
ncbi:replication protein [Aeromonas allosaccharophila]|uniref:replication protein n=1 Tax=Aeromonas allosaccharophila TaxID=656 RepID=UPI0013D7E6C3|nr:replication protein [Aeromonas allosaccharophila]WDO01517.1 replication protein [Aeromonas allosaccharophila]